MQEDKSATDGPVGISDRAAIQTRVFPVALRSLQAVPGSFVAFPVKPYGIGWQAIRNGAVASVLWVVHAT